MKFLEKITRNEARYQRYVGLNFKQLTLLAQKLEPLWKKAEQERLHRDNRIRNIGGGRPYELENIKDKITTVLLYYKQYLTQEFIGEIVGIDQSNISMLLKKMLPLIEETADPELKTYLAQAKEECKKRISSFEELILKHPDLRDVSTDATEQSCFRSEQYEEQKKYYSGKSKDHTIKTQIAVSVTGRILDVSKSYPGRVHDKAVIDEEKTIDKFDKRVPQRFDSGYQGVKNDYPDHYLILPTKKPNRRELTALEKEHNKVNSKRRVIVEHAIAKLKKYRILSGVYRQPLNGYNTTFRAITSLLNFRHNNPAYIC
jgi:predicted XRE-type DNA-binding protein